MNNFWENIKKIFKDMCWNMKLIFTDVNNFMYLIEVVFNLFIDMLFFIYFMLDASVSITDKLLSLYYTWLLWFYWFVFNMGSIIFFSICVLTAVHVAWKQTGMLLELIQDYCTKRMNDASNPPSDMEYAVILFMVHNMKIMEYILLFIAFMFTSMVVDIMAIMYFYFFSK